MKNTNIVYLKEHVEPDSTEFKAHGVTVRINADRTVDIVGAKGMKCESEQMNFVADNINMEAKKHMVLKSRRIDLNPHSDQIDFPFRHREID